MTLVSVLMPIKGDCPFLTYAIQSVRLQSFGDWELVICKDLVDEESESYLKKIISLDPRVKLVDTIGLPLPSALNMGLRQSTGHFIARFDADDIMLPERLEDQVSYMLKNSEVVACGGQVVIIAENSKLQFSAPYYNRKNKTLKSKLDFKCPFPHPGTMIVTAALNQAGGYSPNFKFAEDYELWLRLAHFGDFANLGQPVIAYRSYASQTSARYRSETRFHMAMALAREFNRVATGADESDSKVDADSFQREYLRLSDSNRRILKRFYRFDSFLHEMLANESQENQVPKLVSHYSDFVSAIPRRLVHVVLRLVNSVYSFLRTKPMWSNYLHKLKIEPVTRQSDVYLEK